MSDLEGVLMKFECQAERYGITLSDMTKAQFDAVVELLGIPITFVGGDLSEPALDTFKRTDSKPLGGNWGDS